MLQSQHFLYRVEFGEPMPSGGAQPTPYEMASRLSFLLWRSGPDEALLGKAERGELSTPEAITAEARRMLEDQRGKRVVEFYEQWLDTDELTSVERDPAVFGDLSPNWANLMVLETRSFIEALLESPSGTLGELFTAPYTYANSELAAHYRLSDPGQNNFTRVDSPNSAGILTQGGFISVHDKPTRSSVVLRGLKLRTDLLCQIVPAPPDDVELDLESLGVDLSQRERLAQHRESDACRGCHELIDPLGLAFENFDAVGRYRTVDGAGLPIDSSTEILSTLDSNGPVSGPQELAVRLAQSDQVQQCVTLQSFRFFYGRDADDVDICSQAQLLRDFRGSGFNLKELLVALTTTDAFLYRPEVEL